MNADNGLISLQQIEFDIKHFSQNGEKITGVSITTWLLRKCET